MSRDEFVLTLEPLASTAEYYNVHLDWEVPEYFTFIIRK